MSGFKDFSDGVELPATDLDGYLMRQTVMRFASVFARDTALIGGIVEKSMMAYTEDTKTLHWYDGSAWRPLESHWQTWTPSWLSGSGGTAIAIGNGTLAGRWRYSGGKVDAGFSLVRGSTTNLGAAGYVFGNLPVPLGTFRNSGIAHVLDASGPTTIPHMIHGISTTELAIAASSGRRIDQNGFGITPTAWATSDEIVANIRYEP